MLVIPGAMEAEVLDWLFWVSLAVALAIAGAFADPVNRWLIGPERGTRSCTSTTATRTAERRV
jgi:hypothetical protein